MLVLDSKSCVLLSRRILYGNRFMHQDSQNLYLVEDIDKYMQLDRMIISPCNAKFTFSDFCKHSHVTQCDRT